MSQRSQALVANAWHHRADSLSSLAAAAGVAGVLAGFPLLDPIASIVIAGAIGKAGADTAVGAVRELADERLDDALLVDVENVLMSAGPATSSAPASARAVGGSVLGVRRLRARRMGPSVLLDGEVGVRPETSVADATALTARLREEILAARPEVAEVNLAAFPFCNAVGTWQPARAHDDPKAIDGRHHRTHRGHGAVTQSSVSDGHAHAHATHRTVADDAEAATDANTAMVPAGTGAAGVRELASARSSSRAQVEDDASSETEVSVSEASVDAVHGSSTGAGIVDAAKAVLKSVVGVRGITQLRAIASKNGEGSGATVRIEASILCDLNAPLRAATTTARRAEAALLGSPLRAASLGVDGIRVTRAHVAIETHPL